MDSREVQLDGTVPPPPYDDQQRDRLLYRIAANVHRVEEDLHGEVQRNRNRVWAVLMLVATVLGGAIVISCGVSDAGAATDRPDDRKGAAGLVDGRADRGRPGLGRLAAGEQLMDVTVRLEIDKGEEMLAAIEAATWTPGAVLQARLQRLRPTFAQVSAESGVRRQILEAVAIVESALQPEIKNPNNPAYGLMQIWGPVWFGEPLHDLPDGPTVNIDSSNWTDPLTNARAGAAILVRYGALETDTSWWTTLNRYNGDRDAEDPEYELDVQARYLALLRRDLVGI